MVQVRSAQTSDVAQILDIYAFYVESTAITFEYDVPTREEFEERLTTTLRHYPYLVVEDGNVVQGYAYAGPLNNRAAYGHSCETSIYVRHDARMRGFGRALYDELERRLRGVGICNLYACIASPVDIDEYLSGDSELFHARLGYTKVGTFHKCGYKFGRWYDVIWMEKIIGSHTQFQIHERHVDIAPFHDTRPS